MTKSPKYSIQGNSIQEIKNHKERCEEEFEKFMTPTDSHIWKVAGGTALVSVIIEGVRSFCDKKGIPLPQGELEQLLLKFGPMVAGGITGMIAMTEYGRKEANRVPQIVPYLSDTDFLLGVLIGGGIGAGAGAVGKLVGYGLGQLAGYIF